MAEEMQMDRERVIDLLDQCKEIIGARKGHGDVTFGHMAQMASAYLGIALTAEDAAILMALFKLSRIKCGSQNPDNYIDGANYILIGGSMTPDVNAQEYYAQQAQQYDHLKSGPYKRES